ncbi:MAG: GntR family transcriptional regulator [Gemmatimonadetes bacterium]|nr:GntR family transcriptional regulator [Gemmatimonadota bacterium]
MLIAIDHHSGVPVYRQLMDQIKFHIASGLLKPGEKLPATRALSAQLGVNPMTVSKAYGYLEAEGMVERRRGRPLTVSDLEPEMVEVHKLNRLRQSLAPVAAIARQLGVEKSRALEVFGRMLEDAGNQEES